MKISIFTIDKIILTLLSFIVLVDMMNGFFLMRDNKLPISQIYKLTILLLLIIRLSKSKDFFFIILLLIIFQIGPIYGYVVTGNLKHFTSDVVVAMKWFNVPLSFFYFKAIFQGYLNSIYFQKIKLTVKRSFYFILINLGLGTLGYGMAFYHHGYGNAVGTKGFIYAGNELTILTLTLAFIISVHFYLNKAYKNFFLALFAFLGFAFLITSKTVIAGIIIVFLIPVILSIKFKTTIKTFNKVVMALMIGFPIFLIGLYVIITRSGITDKLAYSMKVNNNDLITILFSNRNNFIQDGMYVFINDFSFLGKILGYGQQYHLNLAGNLAEVDYFTMLFASGFLGLATLVFINIYWLLNGIKLKKNPNYIYAKFVFIFIWFLIIVANTAGHIFGSGIAGYFIGLAIALMFYNKTENNLEVV